MFVSTILVIIVAESILQYLVATLHTSHTLAPTTPGRDHVDVDGISGTLARFEASKDGPSLPRWLSFVRLDHHVSHSFRSLQRIPCRSFRGYVPLN